MQHRGSLFPSSETDSGIIGDYHRLMRGYNLYPQPDTLVQTLKKFGHIASNGLISIPRFGADQLATTISILRDIFTLDEAEADMFTAARDIQKQVLGDTTVMKESFIAGFDETLPDAGVNSDDAIVDVDIEIKDVPSTDLEQSDAMETVVTEAIELQERPVNTPPQPTEVKHQGPEVSKDEIDQLVRDFKHSCSNYHVALKECDASKVVVGPSVIRLNFKLGQGQSLQGLSSHLDVPRRQKQKVLFKDVIEKFR